MLVLATTAGFVKAMLVLAAIGIVLAGTIAFHDLSK